jgi:4'-phosphopantetheinyl transferase
LLDAAEEQRYAGIRRPVEARRFVVAHGILRRIVAERLGTVDALDVRWTYNANGKPGLVGAALQVNLSHSGDLAMVAVTTRRPVGVDLQQILPALDVAAMAERFYPEAEARIVGDLPDRFAELWVRKEALVKAAGDRLTRGLAVPVDGPSPRVVDHDGPFRVTDVEAPTGFRAAVALAGAEPFTVRRQCVNAATQR